MRKLMVTLAVLAAGAWVPLHAQQQPPQPPGQPQGQNQAQLDQQLEQLLDVWEKMLPSTQTVYAEFKAVRKYNSTNGMVKFFNGSAKFIRLPDGTIGARVFLQQIDRTTGQLIPDKYELVICTGRDIYFVDPANKTIHYQPMPIQKVGQVLDQGPLSFLFGMKKAEAKKQYAMKVTKFEPWYSYVDVRPLPNRGNQEFTYARLVIMNQAVQAPQRSIPAFMPREFYWVEPTQDENTWDITRLEQNSQQVQRTDFMKPQLPRDWQLKKLETPPPPIAGGQPGQPGLPGQQPPRVVRE